MDKSAIKVAVRIRPLNEHEKRKKAQIVLSTTTGSSPSSPTISQFPSSSSTPLSTPSLLATSATGRPSKQVHVHLPSRRVLWQQSDSATDDVKSFSYDVVYSGTVADEMLRQTHRSVQPQPSTPSHSFPHSSSHSSDDTLSPNACPLADPSQSDVGAPLLLGLEESTCTESGVNLAETSSNQSPLLVLHQSFEAESPLQKCMSISVQRLIYEDLGFELLQHAFEGYNSTIMAYGQTGSGKSYTMMGYGDAEHRGLIPRVCHDLFKRILNLSKQDEHLTFNVQVSFMEIYCERVRDLLNPINGGKSLRVREHPSLGPYVEDLVKLSVSSYNDILSLMDQGNKARTVASTNMNETSSRSHAVFTIILTQRRFDEETGLFTEKASRLCLVDLAGSERANSTGATGDRLKEGANINKSLTALGKVISVLADKATNKDAFVPYRDSVLTWLLKDSLGGNSKTAIIATVSPADVNIEETLSTLRYADRAKRIVNQAIVNEDPNAHIIRDLKDEVAQLRAKLAGLNMNNTPNQSFNFDSVQKIDADLVRKLRDQLATAEKLMAEANESWEEKLRRTQAIVAERELVLEELGIQLNRSSSGAYIGFSSPKRIPHLVNLNEDPLMNEYLIYPLPPGSIIVGNIEPSIENDTEHMIRLSGPSILPHHATIQHNLEERRVTLRPEPDAIVLLNGQQIDEELEIETGSKITFGELHTFRFNHPEQARRQRSSRQRKCLFYPRSGLEDYSASCHDVLSTSIGTASTISNLSNVTESPVKGCMSPVKIRTIEDVYDSMARRNLQEIEERDINAKTSDGKLNESLTSGNMDETFVVSPAQIEYDLMGKKVQETLLRRVLNRWCRYKARSLILAIMENQAMLKEANVMSKELGHFLEFQFAILDSDTAAYANLKSFWDAADDAEDELRSIKSPTVVVQVVDEFHTSFWTLKRLSKFIHGVRRIYNMDPVDDDIESVTTSDDDIHSPCRFSRIGNAVVPLNLSDKKKELVVPIFSRAEARVCGELALCLTLIHHENGEDVVEVAIESIKPGPYFANFTQVHCQFHQAALDSTLILGSKMDRTFCTDLASKWTDTIMFDYRQTVKIPRKQNDRPDSFKIFVFGAYGEQAEQERRLSNLSDCTAHLSLKPSVPTSLPVQKIMPTSNYDINSWIEVCELAPTGNYMPVPVISDSTFNVLNQDDPGVFILRQGVQRRVVLTLMHDAGPAFPWRRVIDVQISTIRFCTKNDKGVLMETVDNNSHDLSLRLLPSQRMVQKTREGKTLLWVESAWDSSLHESAFLNRVTESNSRVRICLTWYLEVDGFKEPMRLHSDINVQIHPMDTKLTSMQPSSSLNWWWFGSSRTSREIGKVSALFNVTVRSESNSSDSTSYVRGEENLGSWRPKGIELLLETSAMKVWEEFVLDTWSCRKQLNSIFVEDEQSHNTAKGVENNVQQSRLLQRCVGLWKRLLVPRVPSTAALTVKPMDKQSLVAAVEPVQKSVVAHCGYLWYPEQPGLSDRWIRRWCVLCRPYIYIYDDESERSERGVLSLVGSQLQWNLPHLEHILDRENVFCLYTRYHGYLFQAESERLLKKWLEHIDPLGMSVEAGKQHSIK